jgi:multiple sugar transport system permease protein
MRVLVYSFLTAGAGIVLVPFLWMVGTSFKPHAEVFIYPPRLLPEVWRWQNWIEAPSSSYIPFWVFIKNSLMYVLPSLVLDVFVCALVAFSFARIAFRGSRVLFFIMLSTMMLPGQVTMIPMFILYSRLGWVNTFLPLIVPSAFGWPYGIFLLRQFFATIPDQLDEAARIDGCSLPRIFVSIHLPLAKPALGIIGIFSFTYNWSNYLQPLVYLRDMRLWPLALALQTFTGKTSRWEYVMVMSLLTCLPPLALFFIAQRQYIQGIVITGVKG